MAYMSAIEASAALANCRRAGTLTNLPLHQLGSRTDAEAFQMAALTALGGEPCGYKIGATSVEVQQRLNCKEPIHAPILRQDLLVSGSTLRIPEGILGMECEFGFLMGRDFPISADISDIAALQSAIAECFVSP